MDSKNSSIGCLSQFLSTSGSPSSPSSGMESSHIVMIDVDRILPNPYNAYGLREIERLAGMISSNNFHVEAIEVKPAENDNYMIISGHRRVAAWKMLLREGVTEERALPCIIRHFEDMHISVSGDDGAVEDRVITAGQQSNLALILANKGQRKEKTIEEQLWEIQQLEPYVKILYSQKGTPKNRETMKSFFASILDITPTTFQRKKNLLRLTNRARLVLADREISETAAAELSGLPASEQEKVLDLIFEGRMESTVKAISEYKQSLKGNDGECAEDPEDIPGTMESFSKPIPMQEESPAQAFGDRQDWGRESTDSQDGMEETEEEPSFPDLADDTCVSGHGDTDTDPVPARPGPGGGRSSDSTRDTAGSDGDVPEPPDTGNPQNDVHHWFMDIIRPEIERLERIQAHCEKMKALFESSNEKGAALKAARWDSCRSYVHIKILSLKEKD